MNCPLPATLAATLELLDGARALSSVQEVVWLDQSLHPHAPIYHVGMAWEIDGALDVELLGRAVADVARRHDALRTVFDLVDGLPRQRVLASVEVTMAVIDCRGETLSPEQLHAAFVEPFGELQWDTRLLRLGDERHVWLPRFHHLVNDGYGVAVFIHEVADAYNRLRAGDVCAEDAPSYIDFVEDDARYLASPRHERDRQFWREHLADLPEPLLDAAPVAAGDGVAPSERLAWQLPRATFDGLQDFATRHGHGLAHVLMAAIAATFARVHQRERITIGLPVHNRGTARQKRTIGMFASLSPAVLRVDADASFLALVAEAAAETKRSHRHQRLPIAELHRDLRLAQTGRRQLHDVSLSVMNFDGDARFGDARTRVIPLHHGVERTPLVVEVRDHHRGADVLVEFVYVTAHFDRARIESVRDGLAALFDAVLADASRPVASLPVIGAVERERMLADFNATARDVPTGLVQARFEALAMSQPDTTALVFGAQRWSYGVLNARANQVAHRLLALGVQPDDRVAVCMERGLEMVAALLGTLKAGACYVPLDPGYPAERLAGMLEDSAPKALLVDAGRPAWSDDGVPCVGVNADDAVLAAQSVSRPGTLASPANAAYVIYTSGSTGRPKGVVVEHRQVVNFLASMAKEPGLVRSDVLLAVTTIGFDIAGLELYLPLSEGATIVLARRDEAADAQALARLIDEHAVTVMQATPATWRLLVASGWSGRSGLKLLCGGEALSAELSTQLQARVGEVWNVYGPTETTIWSTCRRCVGPTDGVCESIGQPIANTQVYVLDARNEPVPIGVTGELWIAGDGVARGYLNRPELTAERFVADPFSARPGARMYRTGDLCRWSADGTLAYLGRNDFQVKIRGFRIELGEIESRLVQCVGVREATVLAREDRPGDLRLVAYVVGDAPIESLREQLARGLAEFMLPTAWVMLDVLPLTPNGKLDRKALPVPDASALVQQAYEAPQGALEDAIAAIWQELLGVARVGRNDHFFELGGHSLTAVQLIARLRQSLGVDLGLRTLFDRPTLAACAQAVAGVGAKARGRIPRADRSGALPLSLAQQRLWLLDQINPQAATAYHMPGALRLSGPLDLDALQRALDRIVARHESLRTSFDNVNGAVLQRIANEDVGFTLIRHDLSALHGHEQRAALQQHGLDEAATHFDLAAGPLVRARLLRLGEQEHELLITQHHIVSDGWSIGVLLGELRTLYAAFSQDQADPLPPLALQYADYAAWQRDWLQGERLQSQTAYWREHLGGAPALLELPADRARPAMPTHGAGRQAVVLPEDVVRGLRGLAQHHGTTLFMTLLAGWGALLSRLSGQADLVVGVPIANRAQEALEPLIGFFVNTLPLRLQPVGSSDVAQWLAQVRATTLAAFEHQDVPFDQIVDAVQPTRSTSHAPLCQVLFSMNPARRQDDTEVGGTRIRGVECVPTSISFDLVLDLQESDDGVAGSLTYATDLFDATTMARLASQFVTLLRGMLEPSRTLARLPLLDARQREQILEGFNRVDECLPDRRFVHQRFEAHAENHPEAIALMFEGEGMSYGELDRRANQVAHRLLDLGVQTDDRVAVCVDRGFGLIVSLLGILKSGAAYVPLDPAYPADRLAFMLEDCAPRALLTQSGYAPRLAAPGVPCLCMDADAHQFAIQPVHAPDARRAAITPEQLAYVIYTSGSTGRPKGVMNTHGGLRNLVEGQSRWFGIGPRSRVLQFVSMSFDVSLSDIAMTLCQGATLVMASANDLLPGEPLLQVMRSNAVTHVAFPVAVLAALPQDADLGPLEVLIAGGDAMPPALAEHWSSRHRMFNAYGPTEAAVCTALHLCEGPQGASVSIGRPLFGTRMFILDANGELLPPGVAGELHIGGAQVARGYLHRPELSAERFVPDPFDANPGARLYRTGDLARWLADGRIEFLGRNDHQVKIRGFRIEPGEIEARLMQCDGVAEALVVVREDKPGDKRLVAYVRSDARVEALSVTSLRSELAASLAEHMLPKAYVVLPTFPLTPNGKVDRAALPAPRVHDDTAGHVAPRNATEKHLCAIWCDLLQAERIGVHDNFFEVGGHSLLLVQLHREIDVAWPQRLQIADYFKSPTVAALAARLDADQPALETVPSGAARAAARRQQQAANLQQRARRAAR
jgi:amino acid adenylation domain-containing protein